MFLPQKVYFIKSNFPKSPQSIIVLWLVGLARTDGRRQRHDGRKKGRKNFVWSVKVSAHSLSRHTAGTRADYRQASNYSPQKTSQRLQSRRPHPLNPLIRRPSSRIRQSRKIADWVLLMQRVFSPCFLSWIHHLSFSLSNPKAPNKQRCLKENLLSWGDSYCSFSFSSHVFFLSHFFERFSCLPGTCCCAVV